MERRRGSQTKGASHRPPPGTLAPWSLRQGQWKKRLYLSLFERRNLDGARLHCTSPEELREMRLLGIKTPAFWIPLGVEAPDAAPKRPQRVEGTVWPAA